MIGELRQLRRARPAEGFVAGATCVVLLAALLDTAGAETSMGGHQAKSEGQRIYEKANCVGCHKWHGNGGGGYGGAALSLRKTELNRDQIIEVVHCGRPGTGMPHFDRNAYKEYNCYSGVTLQDLGKDAPQDGAIFLRPHDIEVVVDYVLEHIKGKGSANYQDCTEFFGAGARACDIYEKPGASSGAGDSSEAGK